MTNQIDPLSAAIALVSLVLSPALAVYIGPYSVIVFSSTIGAAWALRRNGTAYSAVQKLCYFALINGTAILVTVGIANIVGSWLNMPADTHYLLISPIALLVGGIGNDWPRVLRLAMTFAMSVFERRTGMNGGNKDGSL